MITGIVIGLFIGAHIGFFIGGWCAALKREDNEGEEFMNATREQILAAVNAAPAGVTTAILARRLGATKYNVSGALSKLAAYGFIRKSDEFFQGNRNLGCVWLPKARP
jgi:hypothetical protein